MRPKLHETNLIKTHYALQFQKRNNVSQCWTNKHNLRWTSTKHREHLFHAWLNRSMAHIGHHQRFESIGNRLYDHKYKYFVHVIWCNEPQFLKQFHPFHRRRCVSQSRSVFGCGHWQPWYQRGETSRWQIFWPVVRSERITAFNYAVTSALIEQLYGHIRTITFMQPKINYYYFNLY